MIVNHVNLEAVAVRKNQYPTGGLPEFAFIGKSNVGKSSLINCLINRRSLARTSQTPGKTRTINFYNIEDRLRFVDLPGYGYAKISKSESEKWGKMIESYLLGRSELRGVVFLIDIRHEPSENDRMMLEWLRHYGFAMVVAATKCDKLSANQAARSLSLLKKTLLTDKNDRLIPFSAKTKTGRDELWEIILSAIE